MVAGQGLGQTLPRNRERNGIVKRFLHRSGIREQPALTHRRLKQASAGYLFISPWLLGFVLFTAGPVLASLVLSFFGWSLIQPPHFVGFENYTRMFTDDPLFWQSLQVTLTYVMVSVPLQILFALFLAILLNQKVRMLPLFRTIFYLPSVVSGVAISVLWLWLYQPDIGLINEFLRHLGIKGPAWLVSEHSALPALIGMTLWTVGGPMIIFLAGLQGIPQELYEAAELDGAGEWKKFRHVTLPMLSPVIFFNLILG